MKKCKNCFATKPDTDFYPKLDKLQDWCKACNNEVKRYYSKLRRDKLLRERWDKIYGRTS